MSSFVAVASSTARALRVAADVAFEGDRIARVSSFLGRGATEIDASGRIAAPGFIGLMDRSGAVVLKNGGRG